jgi:hypothetical protein
MKTQHKSIIGVVLLSIVLIIGISLISEKKELKEEARVSEVALGEKIEEMNSPHIVLGDVYEPYNSNPPTSGPHTGNQVAGPGIKDEPIPDEIVVHSLEHGAVVLWYKTSMDEESINRLKKVFAESSGKKIMIPRENMDTPIALTSWGYLLRLDSVDEDKIQAFIETNSDRAPEKAPI